MAGKFEIYQDKAGEYRFRLKAGNGEAILVGEGYKAKAGVENGIESVKKNSGNADCYEAREANDGSHYFVLKAANHQEIGRSQMYKAMASCKNGMESVMNNAADASIDDQT